MAPGVQGLGLERVDEYMHGQIKGLLDKWEDIVRLMRGCSGGQQEEENWKKIEFILKNDAKNFGVFNAQTIEQIRDDVIGREKGKAPCTPLKDKSINLSVKYLNKSSKKNMTRMDSKKSLRSFRDMNDKSASKIGPEVEGNE